MFKKLQFKIVLIMIVFIMMVMMVIGTTLLNNVFSYYTGEFKQQLDDFFDDEHIEILKESLKSEDYAETVKKLVDNC